MLKKFLFPVLSSLTAVLLFAACDKAAPHEQEEAKREGTIYSEDKVPEDSYIVAQVDNTPLTWGEMEKRAMGQMKDDIESNHLVIPSNRIDEAKTYFRRRAINIFVFKTVMLNEAVKEKITISRSDRAESLNTLMLSLRQRNWTTNDFFNKGPLPPEVMRKEFEDSIIIDKLLKVAVRNKLKITNEEIRKEVENLEMTNDLLRVRLEGVRKQLIEGADFDSMARSISQCPSGKDGGDLGEFTRSGRLPKLVEDQAFRQEVGEIGPVIRSTMGYHILKVTAKMPARPKTDTTPAVPESIRLSHILLRDTPVDIKKVSNAILKVKFDEATKAFYKKLLEEASIECYIYKDMKFGDFDGVK